jgi:integrase
MAPTEKRESKGVWKSTPVPCLVRYSPMGSYYIRARIGGGRTVRESLRTVHFAVAKIRLAERLRELRASGRASGGEAPVTLAEALAFVRAEIAVDPSLKANTRRSYLEELDCLKAGAHAAPPATPLARLRASEMAAWWTVVATKYKPQRANHLLMFVRRALKVARKAGSLTGDPTEELKRLKIPRTRLDLVTLDQFRAIVASVRAQWQGANREEAGNWIEWMAYSGMRPGEIGALVWRDVDMRAKTVRVTGGEFGTKNHEERILPMNPALLDLAGRMARGKPEAPVFSIDKPRDALRNACRRLGFKHMRIYDLRHLFATVCNTSGMDVPTIAGLLGHKDGGALAMRTYVQTMQEHVRASVAKVSFQ